MSGLAPASFLLTNFAVPRAARLGNARDFGTVTLHAGHIIPDAEAVRIEPETATMSAATPGGDDAPAGTFLEIVRDGVRCVTSRENPTPLYLYLDRSGARLALFNDLFVGAWVLEAAGQPVRAARRAGRTTPWASALAGVQRVEFGVDLRVSLGRGLDVEVRLEPDDLQPGGRGLLTDRAEAGERVLEALRCATETMVGEARAAGVLLSGGVDSGAVAYFASRTGVPLTAFSLGTPWGDEFAGAAETAGALGVPLETRRFVPEELWQGLVEAIRWLGVSDATTVHIALLPTCFYRSAAGPRHLLTGYGNDLLNAGIYQPFTSAEALDGQILDAVRQTRWSNEFSALPALAHGIRVRHPYWSREVMQAALGVSGACKVAGGRDKAYFRAAMSKHLPAPTAWRSKLPIHVGSGVDGSLGAHLDRLVGRPGGAGGLYRTIVEILLQRVGAGDLTPDPAPVFEQALHAVRR